MSFADLVSKQTRKFRGGELVERPLFEFLEKTSVFDSGERGHSLHASEMYYFCPRGGALRHLLPVVPTPDISLQAKFDIGHAMHAWYQNRYLGPAGLIKGTWACSACGKRVVGKMPRDLCECTKQCVQCTWPKGAKLERVCQLCYRAPSNWSYVEMPLRWEQAGIVGKCDGILDKSGTPKISPEDIVMDLKTITPGLFGKLRDAKDAHKYQVRLYMKMLGLTRGVVVYIDKSADDKTPIKEFEVGYDEADLQDALDKANAYRRALRDRIIPPRVRCDARDHGCAKFCDCAGLCFDEAKVEELQKGWVEG